MNGCAHRDKLKSSRQVRSASDHGPLELLGGAGLAGGCVLLGGSGLPTGAMLGLGMTIVPGSLLGAGLVGGGLVAPELSVAGAGGGLAG